MKVKPGANFTAGPHTQYLISHSTKLLANKCEDNKLHMYNSNKNKLNVSSRNAIFCFSKT